MIEKVYIITDCDGYETQEILCVTTSEDKALEFYEKAKPYSLGNTVYLKSWDENQIVTPIKSKTSYLEVRENDREIQ